MKVTIVGCGYVGLVTGVCLAKVGHNVLCMDKDERKIDLLREGHLPFHEPYVKDLIDELRAAQQLAFTEDAGGAVQFGDIIFICVGTPPLKNGEADLAAIDNVARFIATESKGFKLVVSKSTVPIRSGEKLRRSLSVYSHNRETQFLVASNPEFLREGSAVHDFMHPDRIVIGVDSGIAEAMLRELYDPVVRREFHCPIHSSCPHEQNVPFLVTSIKSAELIKHASNSFLALKISYANAIADLCEKLGGNIDEVVRGMGYDPRIGPEFLGAGLGFGGFCLPKDLQTFIRVADRAGVDFSLLKEVERINRHRVQQFLENAREALWVFSNKRIGLLGLSFKPNTDDIRFAPALEIGRRLLAEGATVSAYDPQAMGNARTACSEIQYCADPYEVAKRADALLLVTEWEEFGGLDWSRIRQLMLRPLVFDGRNFLNADHLKMLGFEYHSVGRPERDSPYLEKTGASDTLAKGQN